MMNMGERLTVVAVGFGWYLFIRWCLTHAYVGIYDTAGLWSFPFWSSTLMAIPATFLATVILGGIVSVIHWIITGD